MVMEGSPGVYQFIVIPAGRNSVRMHDFFAWQASYKAWEIS
jgi:hypothetical protein